MFQFTLVASPCAVTEVSQINNNKKKSNSNSNINNNTDCYNNKSEYILMNSISNGIHQTIDYFCGVVCEKWRNAPMYGACKNDDL